MEIRSLTPTLLILAFATVLVWQYLDYRAQVESHEAEHRRHGIAVLNAFESVAIRVLSPRMLPPLTLLVGSTASTATRWLWRVSDVPSASMKVLFPAPGTPLTPTRQAPPVAGKSASSTSWANPA